MINLLNGLKKMLDNFNKIPEDKKIMFYVLLGIALIILLVSLNKIIFPIIIIGLIIIWIKKNPDNKFILWIKKTWNQISGH